MKTFMFILFFNPTQGYHLHTDAMPLEISAADCVVEAPKAQKYFTGKIKEDFEVGCIEAVDYSDAISKLLNRNKK